MSEKTEQPSAKRLREARRNGQLPRSRLLSSSVVTLGGAAVEPAVGGFQRQPAALGHGVAGVDRQVQDDHLGLGRVRKRLPE